MVSQVAGPRVSFLVLAFAAPWSRKSGSQWTFCWRKPDSNSRSHRERKGRARAAQWPSREST